MSPTRPPYPRAHPPSQPHFSVTGHLPCCEGRDPANHNVTRLGGGGRAGWAEEGGADRPAKRNSTGPAGRAEEEGAARTSWQWREDLLGWPSRPAGRTEKERPGRLGGGGEGGPAGRAEEMLHAEETLLRRTRPCFAAHVQIGPRGTCPNRPQILNFDIGPSGLRSSNCCRCSGTRASGRSGVSAREAEALPSHAQPLPSCGMRAWPRRRPHVRLRLAAGL